MNVDQRMTAASGSLAHHSGHSAGADAGPLAIWIGVGWFWGRTTCRQNVVWTKPITRPLWDLARRLRGLRPRPAVLAPAVFALLIATVWPVLVRHVAKNTQNQREEPTVLGSSECAGGSILFALLWIVTLPPIARSVGGAIAAVVVGLPEPAAVSLRCLVGPC
jgi:hypothetical protein